LAEDSQARGRWRTDQSGSYFAVGVGGHLYGRGADVLLIDDRFGSIATCDYLLAQQAAGGDRWTVVSLAAVSDGGAALWPERFDINTSTTSRLTPRRRNGWRYIFKRREGG
jgi:hypothetical protein